MSILTAPAPAWNADGEAIWPLAELLYERHYDDVQRRRILMYAVANRHLAGVVASGELDPEDEAEAYQCIEQSFAAVPYDAPAWFAEPEDFETWEIGSPVQRDAVLVPPDADFDAEHAAFWPGGVS
jgi:hypothetical protein